MVDFHSHLFFESFDDDREATLGRAFDAGVKLMLSVGTEPEDNLQAIEMARLDDRICAAVGLHPHWFRADETRSRSDELQMLEDELRTMVLENGDKVRAIGECGLDYFSRDPEHPVTDAGKEAQQLGFRMQLALARELQLPVVIHCRTSSSESGDAYEDVRAVLAEEAEGGQPGARVMHCYMGDVPATRGFLAVPHVLFSLAGNVTYPVKRTLAGTDRDPDTVLKLIPPERLLTETDCPFLPPVPHRGERNEPAYVAETTRHIARVKGMAPQDFERQVEDNARRVLGLV